MMKEIGIGLIGCGSIALANHIPGIGYTRHAVVTALCDSSPEVLQAAVNKTGISKIYSDFTEMLENRDVNAVIIATPNVTHAPIVKAAIANGKHVFCEKPIGLNYPEAAEMVKAADQAGVKHMTAFTYRFTPAIKYMRRLIESGFLGQPYHFRAQRFQDWGTRSLGWRQMAELAGSGELADMLSHRIDFAHYLVGSIRQVVARLRRFLDKRGGAVSDVDDWVSMIIEFESGASGVLESSKLCTGTGEGPQSRDYCEINGSEGSLAYSTQTPLELRAAQKGANSFARMPVPDDLLKHPASTRNPRDGDPLLTFRYDQDAEFINAIIEDRPCVPSLMDGALAQAVMDAAIISSRERRWMELNSLTTSNH